MEFRVLGPLEVEREGRPIPVSGRRRRALLLRLLIDAGRVVSADELIDAVWGDEVPSDPANALQYQIARLRKTIDADRVPGAAPVVLQTRSPGYTLVAEPDRIDAGRFERLVAAGRAEIGAGRHARARDLLREALELWRGAPFADVRYEVFAQPAIRSLEELRLTAWDLLLDAELALGRHAEAVGLLGELTSQHPLREALWERLMVALYRSGRQAEALDVYAGVRARLTEELGIEPGPALRDLHRAILSHDPALSGPAASPASPLRAPLQLPHVPTSFVGRERELALVAEQLRAGRLLTLAGPGGVGKTRLIIEAARAASGDYDAAYFVPLETVTEPELVIEAVAARVGIDEDGERDLVGALVDHLDGQRALLVLDNCEHVLETVALLAHELRGSCEGVSLLATSRERLGIPGETALVVEPLGLPSTHGLVLDDLEAAPAVRLFLDRARAVDPAYEPGEEDLVAIAAIVLALDGLPLAIELAAARTRLLSPVEIAEAIGDRLGLFDTAARTAPPRQRSLRATVDWSYGLLRDRERRGFDALSVFSDCFGLEAATAVMGGEDEDPPALELLSALVDKSLVVRERVAGGRTRYRLLAILRQFGREQLERSGAAEAVRLRHLQFFAERARMADRGIRGRDQERWLHWFDDERDNIRAALAWALESGHLGDGMRLAAALGRYWDWRGDLVEGRRWAKRLLEAAGAEPVPDKAAVLAWAAYFAAELGEAERADRLANEAVLLAETSGEHEHRVLAYAVLALLARGGVDGGGPAVAAERALALAREAGDAWGVAWALNNRALEFLERGALEEAQALAERAARQFADLGDRRGVAWALAAQALVERRRGRLDRAESRGWEAFRLSHSLASTHAANVVLKKRLRPPLRSSLRVSAATGRDLRE